MPIELQDRKYGVRVAIIADLELVETRGFRARRQRADARRALRARFPTQVTDRPGRAHPRSREPAAARYRVASAAGRAAPDSVSRRLNYFELDRGGELWKQLEQTGSLAMHIAGEFPGLELEFWAIRHDPWTCHEGPQRRDRHDERATTPSPVSNRTRRSSSRTPARAPRRGCARAVSAATRQRRPSLPLDAAFGADSGALQSARRGLHAAVAPGAAASAR